MASKKESLLKKREKKFNELIKYGGFIKGTISPVRKKGSEGPEYYHLTYKDQQQKTHTKYIPIRLLEQAQKAIDHHKRVNDIINEISEINLALLKEKD